MYKSKRAKATDIPKKVKDKVWERDHERCIYCGSRSAMPSAHALLSRAQGGLGIEKNVVTLCFMCHRIYDQGSNDEKKKYARIVGKPEIGKYIRSYLEAIYGPIREDEIKYRPSWKSR